MHTAHAESSAKVDEREREREGARAGEDTSARAMDVFSCHVVTLPHEDEETNSRVREATSAWRQSSDAAVVHDRETRRVRW